MFKKLDIVAWKMSKMIKITSAKKQNISLHKNSFDQAWIISY